MSKIVMFFDESGLNKFNKGLRLSSLNQSVAAQREAVYGQVMENEAAMRGLARSLGFFSSSSDTAPSQLGVALGEASLKAYINSFAGYISIERPMSQMREMMVYQDLVTKSGANVMPMIGQDNPRDRAGKTHKSTLNVGQTTDTISLGKALVAGSIMITLKSNGETTTAVDNRKGQLLAESGVLTAGTVDYETGDIVLNFTNAAIAGDNISISYAEDKIVADAGNRTKFKQGYFDIAARVNKYEFEMDLIGAMIAKKTVGTDMIEKIKTTVYDEHTLAINNALVNAIKNDYAGNTLNIDLSGFSIAAGFFDTVMKVFASGLASVDTAIAARTYKAVAATAYVVGKGMATLFGSFAQDQVWVPNNSGYVNGLVGFYQGRAVLRHLGLDDFEGYAIHKTADGELAPTALGILLPATDLPLVGNFNNTNEVAGGIYSVDGASSLAKDLVQRFTLEMPSDWMRFN